MKKYDIIYKEVTTDDGNNLEIHDVGVFGFSCLGHGGLFGIVFMSTI
jgi:hypothetical protein